MATLLIRSFIGNCGAGCTSTDFSRTSFGFSSSVCSNEELTLLEDSSASWLISLEWFLQNSSRAQPASRFWNS